MAEHVLGTATPRAAARQQPARTRLWSQARTTVLSACGGWWNPNFNRLVGGNARVGRQAVAPHCANHELAGPSLSHYRLSSVRGRRSKAFSADQRRLGIARTPPPRYTLRNQGDGWRPKAHCPRGALRLRRLIRSDAACELHAEHLILPSHHSPARVPLIRHCAIRNTTTTTTDSLC